MRYWLMKSEPDEFGIDEVASHLAALSARAVSTVASMPNRAARTGSMALSVATAIVDFFIPAPRFLGPCRARTRTFDQKSRVRPRRMT